MADPERFWFPAKRYGWGWGPPVTWQGWVALVVFVMLVVAGVFLFPPAEQAFSFVIYTVLMTVAFGVVCYVKGEPPKWRWGDR
jgi:hypothetical protein